MRLSIVLLGDLSLTDCTGRVVTFTLSREQLQAACLEVGMFLGLLGILGRDPVAVGRPLAPGVLVLRTSPLLRLLEFLLLAEEPAGRRWLDVDRRLGDRGREWCRTRRLEVPSGEGRMRRLDLEPLEVDVVVEVEGQSEQSVDLGVLEGQVLVELVDFGLSHLDIRGLGLALIPFAFGLVGSRHRGIRPLLLGPCTLRLRSGLRLRPGSCVGTGLRQTLLVLHLCKESASTCHVLSPSVIERISLY
jgi:hypothetical protein